MTTLQKACLLLTTLLLLTHCKNDELPIDDNEGSIPQRSFIEPQDQRSGDASMGYDYLINGDYVSSGIPYDLYVQVTGENNENVLDRTGDNAILGPDVTTVIHPNGTKMVAPNCLACHAQRINGEYIIGLGDTAFDYSEDRTSTVTLLNAFVSNTYGMSSDEWQAYEPFGKATAVVNENIIMDVRGVNPADQLTAVLVAHRDPETLEWIDDPALDIPTQKIPTDVPAWWLLKKKNAMFYSGIGRGDFSKFLMASSLLTLQDTTEAAEIDKHFVDVLAWINNLEAPVYPGDINKEMAEEGRLLFESNCASCHGTYGDDETYPNLLIFAEEVGTDATLVDAYGSETFGTFVNWYNESWFAQGEHAGRITTGKGYIAPPLDGIWATAPYLHNASVPNLESLLNSETRPTYWKRNFSSPEYDMRKVGWPYEELSSAPSSQTYDTTLPGYGNAGHTFGDNFTEGERKAVMEYLKTL